MTTSPSSRKWHVCGQIYEARSGAEAVGMFLSRFHGYQVRYDPVTDELTHRAGATYWRLDTSEYNPMDYEEWIALKREESGDSRAEAEVARLQALRSREPGTT